MSTLADRALRLVLTGVHKLVTLGWLVRRPRTYGAHALALTPERRLILVKLRYASGWRLPGGGQMHGEDPRDAVLRELVEEIGMTGHGSVTLGAELEERSDFKRDLAALLVVRDVHYSPPRWSWEVERIVEAPLDALPGDLAPVTIRWIELLRAKL